MTTDRFAEARKQGFIAGLKLATAIQEAGGSLETVTRDIQEGMTFLDFIARVAAANNIEVVFNKPKTEGEYGDGNGSSNG